MFAQELHRLDVSKPPPPIDDSFPHPTLLEQLRVTDAQRVQQFLSSTQAGNDRNADGKAHRSTIPVNISTFRAELCEALHVLENLKHSKLVLDQLLPLNDDESDERWKEEVERTEQLKGVIRDILEPLENEACKKTLTQKLATRRKKRAWLKRRNKRLQADRAAEQAARSHRLEEIARWQAEWNDRLNQERVSREELQMKTLILTDVRRRKARAKRMVTRFEKSLHLYQQRQSAANVPNVPNAQSEERFVGRMYSLIAEWNGKVGECIKEEKRLKDELNRQSTGNASRRRENRWRKVLFGTAAIGGMFGHHHHQSKDWWQELIDVRRAWDKFCLPTASDQIGSSAVPTTWIMPPEQPSPEWEVYRETNNKTKR